MHGATLFDMFAALSGFAAHVQAAAIKGRTNNAFLDPPNVFRPTVRFCLPDASVNTDILKSDLEGLADVGFGGFEFVPFYLYGLSTKGAVPPVDWNKYGYGSAAYKQVFNTAIRAAENANLLMSFALGANQGQGAPAKMESVGLAKELAYASVTVRPGTNFTGQLPLPLDHPPGEELVSLFQHETYDRIEQKLIAVVAGRIENVTVTESNTTVTYLEESSLTAITAKVADKKINFSPPKNGTWQIFTFYERFTNQKSCTGAPVPDSIIGNGSWIVDHFSDIGAQVTTDFIDTNVLDRSNTAALSKVGQYAWEDSMEMYAPAHWTPNLLAQFESKRGYDLTKYLPVIFNGENTWGRFSAPYGNQTFLGAATDGGLAVNDDYRTTLTELNRDYIKGIRDWAKGKGLEFSNQPSYNLPLDMAATIPIVDTPETESLSFPTLDNLRYFTGPAHMSQKSIISSETGALTQNSAAYSQTIPELLTFVNRQLVTGVNMFVLHGTPYSGEYPLTTWPSYTAFFYNVPEMHSKCQPSWSHYKYSMDYIARNSYISQIGTARIDVAFLLSSAAFKKPALESTPLTSAGYSYEYVGVANLDSEIAKIRNQLLAPHGPAFRTLVIDGDGLYPFEVASKIERFAHDGLPIVFLNKVPDKVSGVCRSPCNLEDFKSRLQGLVAKYPKTVVSNSMNTLPQILTSVGVKPRVRFTNKNWFHTMWKSVRNPNAEFVYFWNPNATSEASISIEFLDVMYPYKFDAWTGSFNPIVAFSRYGKNISMTLKLSAGATTIVAFTKDKRFNEQTAPELHVPSTSQNALQFESRNGEIVAHVVGDASVTLSNGEMVDIRANVSAASTLQNWDITIEDWHPTSNLSKMTTEITNHTFSNTTLKSWADFDLSNVSGIGHYTTSFNLSTANAIISLGSIQNTVKAYLNGKELPPIDLFNAVFDISDYAQVGVNQLKIDIATTLFNAVKSRSSKITTAGAPAAFANPRLAESVPSAKYGLTGPVVVTPYEVVKIA